MAFTKLQNLLYSIYYNHLHLACRMIVISITDKWYKHTTYKGEEFAHTSLHLG